MLTWTERPLPEGVEELGRAVKRQALRVHRHVGPGFREHVYQRCLAHALGSAGHKVREQVELTVSFDGLRVPRAGVVDMIVDDTIVVELKARADMHPAYRAQVVGYLRASGHALGLLLNFHAPRLLREGTERIVHPDYLTLAPASGPGVLGSPGPPAKRPGEGD